MTALLRIEKIDTRLKYFTLYSLAAFTLLVTSQGFCQQAFTLTEQQKLLIGNKIWHNEGLGQKHYLSVWNEGEDFPSFGIGHFIWYPPNARHTFIEQFPQFLAFANEAGMSPPSWLTSPYKNPWHGREQFYDEFNDEKMRSLRDWLASTVMLQAEFILLRMEAALPKMLRALSSNEQQMIKERFYKVAQQPSGAYALIDYVNFKGEGTSVKERYQGQGWGLLQVLENLDPLNPNIMHAFAKSADEVLTRRVSNAPRDESRWLKGWRKRIQTYTQPIAAD